MLNFFRLFECIPERIFTASLSLLMSVGHGMLEDLLTVITCLQLNYLSI